MKKTLRKLVLHHETLRALRALDDKSLTHAVGGGDALLERETRRLCTEPAVATAVCNG